MNFKISSLSACLALSLFACDKSDSSSGSPPAPPAPLTATDKPGPGDAIVADAGRETSPGAAENTTAETPPPELQDAITLNSNFLEYKRLQYDCGDIAAPLDAATVESKLKGAQSFQSLAATIPAKDQALLTIASSENGVACTYRALFSVNKAFTELSYDSSQSLNSESFTDCSVSKGVIDSGFGAEAIAFEYDKKFIRWVALHIPLSMQASPVCATGELRAVFSGATL